MSAILALLAARKAGATVFVRDGRLVVQSQGALPDDVRNGLRAQRDRLVDMLSLQPTKPTEPPLCVPCGRPQHQPDVVCSPGLCPSWTDPDPSWPIAAAYVPPAGWRELGNVIDDDLSEAA